MLQIFQFVMLGDMDGLCRLLLIVYWPLPLSFLLDGLGVFWWGRGGWDEEGEVPYIRTSENVAYLKH